MNWRNLLPVVAALGLSATFLVVPPAAAGPALVCLPGANLPLDEVVNAGDTDGCGADASDSCDQVEFKPVDDVLASDETRNVCVFATNMGDCEVAEGGGTITGWAVSGTLSSAGPNDFMHVGLYCMNGEEEETAVAGCTAFSDGVPCSDEGAPEPGQAECLAFSFDDDSDGIPPSDWVYEYACEDPVLLGLFPLDP